MEEACLEVKAIEGRYVAARLVKSDKAKAKYSVEEPILEFFYSNDENPDKSVIKDKKIIEGCFIGTPQYASSFFTMSLPSGLKISKHKEVTLPSDSISKICQWLDVQFTEEEKEKYRMNYNPSRFDEKNGGGEDFFHVPEYTPEEIEEYLHKKRGLFENKILLAEEAIEKITELQREASSTEEKIILLQSHKNLLKFQKHIENKKQEYENHNFFIESGINF